MMNGACFEIIDSDERTLQALSSIVNCCGGKLLNQTNVKELSCQYEHPVFDDDSAYASCHLSSTKCCRTKQTGSICFLNPFREGETHTESEEVAEVQCSISYMYELYEEKQKALQKENEIYIRNYLDKNSVIFSQSVLSKRYNKIEILVNHVNKIASEVNKLKSTLQKNVLNDFWKMHIDYHRSAVNFFSLARTISEDIDKAVNCIKSLDRLQLENVKKMQLNGRRLITELYQSADIISEFQNCLETIAKQDSKTESSIT